MDTLLEALGRAEITGKKMIAKLYPELAHNILADSDPIALPPMIGQSPAYSSRPGECCMPLPGDRIIGISRKGDGICYHVVDCDELAKHEEDEQTKWVDLKWPADLTGAIYRSRIFVTMANDSGVLGRVCTTIGENNANIEQVDFTERRADYYSILIEISVRDVDHLLHIINALKTDAAISSVSRHRKILISEESTNA